MTINRKALALMIACTTAISLIVWHRDPIGGLDLVAYISAFQIFMSGGDPYSSSQLYVKQQELGLVRNFPVFMWNPPLFLSYFSPLLSLPTELAPSMARALSFACALVLAYLGYRLSDLKDPAGLRSVPYLIPALCLLPFWTEIKLAQNTSWVALAFAGGCSLFIRGERPYLAGLLLSVSACKPHNFFIPLLLLSIKIVRNRNWRVVAGSLVSLVVAGSIAEVVNPGIWGHWLFRKEWPINSFCANLSTIFGLIFGTASTQWAWITPSLSIGLGLLLWAYGVRRYDLTAPRAQLMWGWLVTPFFAPYGYLSDHVTLIFPLAYFAGEIGSRKGGRAQYRFLLALLLISIVGALLPANPFNGESLSWFLFAPGALIAVAAALGAQSTHNSDEDTAYR